ncbi:hypothetical protein FOZ60_004779 [Perkinsus olseni]|uniref:Uncharacterized protein n=1 Tax=Perkinsus olseni TaxID=32597 RepID=A0A7J6NSD6_PEROL|nr:hypothetical protein FOZ60_004779 [Perkinsus olseni]
MHPAALFLALVLQHVSGDIDNLRFQDPSALAVHGTGTTTSQDPYSKPTGRCFYGELEGCICPKGIEPVYTMKRIRGYDRVGSIVCTPRCSEDKDCPAPQHGFGVKAFCASNGRCLLSCSKFYTWCPFSSRCRPVNIGGSSRYITDICLYDQRTSR